MLLKALAIAAAIGRVSAQRPDNTSICDYYTTALLKNNTADNQLTLLTLLVNTAVIGNYTQPNHNAVPGILAPGEVNGTKVNLLPYFNGSFASANRGGSSGVSINFLDDGGAAPLKENKPANGTHSNQYHLLTHLYDYFGSILGCSQQGMPGYSAYKGEASQYQVHKYMDLGYAEVTYFINQVALSAQSFGVAEADVQVAGKALNSLFNVRYAPPTTVIPAQGAHLQSICDDDTCPLAVNSTMAGYSTNITEPSAVAPAPTGTPTGSGAKTSHTPTHTATGTGHGSSASATAASSAGVVEFSFMAAFGGLFALFL